MGADARRDEVPGGARAPLCSVHAHDPHARVLALSAPDAHDDGRDGGPRARRRGHGIRRHGRHGPPRAAELRRRSPMFEAMVTNAWIAARTSDLQVGSLVLCDSFRHPVVLAREAVSIDHASSGRFELGIGWGSVTAEFEAFGVGSPEPRYRVSRLRESLEVMTRALARGGRGLRGGALPPLRRPGAARRPRGRSRSPSGGPAAARWSWSPPMPTGGTST